MYEDIKKVYEDLEKFDDDCDNNAIVLSSYDVWNIRDDEPFMTVEQRNQVAQYVQVFSKYVEGIAEYGQDVLKDALKGTKEVKNFEWDDVCDWDSLDYMVQMFKDEIEPYMHEQGLNCDWFMRVLDLVAEEFKLIRDHDNNDEALTPEIADDIECLLWDTAECQECSECYFWMK